MTVDEILALVKENLEISDDSKDRMIEDRINDVLIYCNLNDIPERLEPFVRKKVKAVIDYEAENGSSAFDVKSIKEGDTSITYNVNENTSKEAVYGLSKDDKKCLQLFRRTRR